MPVSRAFAEGEKMSGYPNWQERVLIEWMNRARVAPQTDLAGCTAGHCLESACYTSAATPRYMDYDLDQSSRFHSDHLRINSYFDHPSHCTLVANIANLYPNTCGGAASCSCTQGALVPQTDPNVVPPEWTDPFVRMNMFGAITNQGGGEIIAAGPSDPNAMFYFWLYEQADKSTCGFDEANGHRYLILTQGNGASTGAGWVSGPGGPYTYYATMDFGGVAGDTYKIPSGSHFPQQAASVDAWANWYDSAGPSVAKIDVDGVCSDMTLTRGSATNGAWHATVSGVGSGCHRYVFAFKDSLGGQVVYPTTGSLAIGTGASCPDWDVSIPAMCSGFSQTYTVTPSVGSHGSVTPSTTRTIAQGATAAFTVTPASGYIASVGGTCGGQLSGSTYTTNPIFANCSVAFNFVTGALTQPLVVWRPNSAIWYSLAANGTQSSVQWGLPGDKSFYLDMNNDGVADYVVWRPSTAVWYVRTSPSQSTITQFGLPSDIPLPATNWEPVIGSGISPAGSIAVWRPSTAVWYFTSGLQQFGLQSDIPLERTYSTGTAKSVYRPSTGVWYSDRTPAIQQFGLNGDVPVPGDYDGDGIPDFAVWRPSTGVWYIMPSASPGSVQTLQFGLPSDMPVPHDYDGDGKTDMAVWRPSTGVWYITPSSHPAMPIVKQWGLPGDVPAYRPMGAQ